MGTRSKLARVAVVTAWISVGNAALAQLELRHSAPILGSNLTLEVRGATPGSAIALFVSSGSAHRATPWGVSELERAHTTLEAHGWANGAGDFVYTTSLPPNPALSELEKHFQALVRPFGGPGAQLTPAVHLRLLGSRAYVGFEGWEGPDPVHADGGLEILSLVHHQRVATVDYGRVVSAPGARGAGKPVFSANFARGAVMPASDELVVFDPFFGRVLARLAFQGASRAVFSDRTHSLAYVLDGVDAGFATPRLHAIDLASASIVATLSLGNTPLPTLWSVDAERGIAYIADSVSLGGQASLRRVDLDLFVDLGALAIGNPGETGVSALALSAERVFAATQSGWPGSASLTRVVETPTGPLVSVAGSIGNTSLIEPLPQFGAIVQWSHFPTMPGGSLWLERAGISGGGTTSTGVLQFGGVIDVAPSLHGFWCVSANSGFRSGGYTLGEYDIANATWTDWNASIYVNTPAALDVVRDANGERACIAADGVIGDQVYERPRVYVIGPQVGQEVTIAIGPRPASLRVISVP